MWSNQGVSNIIPWREGLMVAILHTMVMHTVVTFTGRVALCIKRCQPGPLQACNMVKHNVKENQKPFFLSFLLSFFFFGLHFSHLACNTCHCASLCVMAQLVFCNRKFQAFDGKWVWCWPFSISLLFVANLMTMKLPENWSAISFRLYLRSTFK